MDKQKQRVCGYENCGRNVVHKCEQCDREMCKPCSKTGFRCIECERYMCRDCEHPRAALKCYVCGKAGNKITYQ
jgi:hypothetical protein